MHLGHLLVYYLILLVSALANALPISWTTVLARWTGRLVYVFYGKRKKIALHNLDLVFGETIPPAGKEEIIRKSFENIAVSAAELFMVKRIKQTANDRFTMQGFETMRQAFQKGKGVVLAIAHVGSWELLSFLPYLREPEWAVIVKEIRNPYLNDEINRLRKVMTVTPILKQDPSAVKTILKQLKKNQGVAVLIDQWAGPEGIWVDFFGKPTSTTSMPARLAIKTGCEIIPAYCLRQSPGKYLIDLEPPLALDTSSENAEKEITLELNRRLEDRIRKNPDLWLWGHRRWKEKPHTMREL